MQAFFIYQPETFRTINLIFGFRLGGLSAVLWFGGLFIVLAVIGYMVYRRRVAIGPVLLIAAAIAWLPLFAQSSYSSFLEFKNTEIVLGAPEREQIIWRYCRMDKYQDLGGGPCGLYPYIEEVRKHVPANSSVGFVTAIWAPYFTYYLYDSYRLKPASEAEYVIVYRPVEELKYENGQLYEAGKLLGNFKVIADFASDRIIYQRIAS